MNIRDTKIANENFYKAERDRLKTNLEALFLHYRERLTGEQADTLIKVRKTGYSMIDEIDFLYTPSFFSGSVSEQKESDNYHYISDAYRCANTLMDALMEQTPSAERITLAKNALENTMKERFPGLATSNRVKHGFGAAFAALCVFAGIALALIAVTAPVSIPVAILLGAAGLFTATAGCFHFKYSVGHANDNGKKYTHAFADAASELVSPPRKTV